MRSITELFVVIIGKAPISHARRPERRHARDSKSERLELHRQKRAQRPPQRMSRDLHLKMSPHPIVIRPQLDHVRYQPLPHALVRVLKSAVHSPDAVLRLRRRQRRVRRVQILHPIIQRARFGPSKRDHASLQRPIVPRVRPDALAFVFKHADVRQRRLRARAVRARPVLHPRSTVRRAREPQRARRAARVDVVA